MPVFKACWAALTEGLNIFCGNNFTLTSATTCPGVESTIQ